MQLTSIIAIYALFWSFCFFLVLPFRLRTSADPDVLVPGQAESAPPRFSFGRTCLWTTVVATAAFGLFYANYVEGWVVPDQLDLFSGSRTR